VKKYAPAIPLAIAVAAVIYSALAEQPAVTPPPPVAAPVDITKPWPSPEVVQNIKMPPPRSKKEVDPVLAALPPMTDAEKQRPFHIILCAAEKDPGHNGPGFHDYPIWRERWTKILAGVPAVTAEPADKWPTEEQFKKADAIAFFHHNPEWTAARGPELDAFLARGGGLVFLHSPSTETKNRSRLRTVSAARGRATNGCAATWT